MIKKKKEKKWIFLLHLNEFNLNDGFKNYIVPNIFYAPSMKKMYGRKKNIYIYIHTQSNMLYLFFLLHYSKINQKNKK